MKRILVCLLVAVASFGLSAYALPQQINYQGQLTNPGGAALDTTISITFKLYTDSTNGNVLWTETRPAISVSRGLFNVRLGQLTPLTDAVLNQSLVWLGITVGADAEMTPRTRLVSVAYAYRVGTVDAAGGGTIFGDVNINGKGNIGTNNTNVGQYAFVAGVNNHADDQYSSISGGVSNHTGGTYAHVSGGGQNQAGDGLGGTYQTVGGGGANYAGGSGSTVAGGQADSAKGNNSVISGGSTNTASGFYSTIGGGLINKARGNYSVVAGGGGPFNLDSNSAIGVYSSIGGGLGNLTADTATTVAGGAANWAFGSFSTVGGGSRNHARGVYSVIGGGGGLASADTNFVAALGDHGTISGGRGNAVMGSHGSIGGGSLNRAALGATVAGGNQNLASGSYSAAGGGSGNAASGDYGTVGGGNVNAALGTNSYVGGGYADSASGINATISGGYGNWASGYRSTVGGGAINYSTYDYASIGGGVSNYASGTASHIGGGDTNHAYGYESMIPGGHGNTTQGSYSFAGGYGAYAGTNGSFVWADATGGGLSPLYQNMFMALASGGISFFSSPNLSTGVYVSSGGSGWNSICDSTKKANIQPVNTAEVLDKVVRLPISEWNYKTQDASIRHMGPMAQNFHAAFQLGESDTTINSLDPDGVALAAIQELAKRVDELTKQNQKQQAQIESLLADKRQSAELQIKGK